MPLLEKLKNIFSSSGSGKDSKKKLKQFLFIKRDVNPSELWNTVSELGDGAYGKVFKVDNDHIVENIL